jgi:hypothetical protein
MKSGVSILMAKEVDEVYLLLFAMTGELPVETTPPLISFPLVFCLVTSLSLYSEDTDRAANIDFARMTRHPMKNLNMWTHHILLESFSRVGHDSVLTERPSAEENPYLLIVSDSAGK